MLMAKSIGERIREAREMQGYSQLRAAQLMGYANSTKLSKIETGTDSVQIPLWFLRRCVSVYDVSLDYLFGVTDSMGVGEKRGRAAKDTIKLMQNEWHLQRLRDMSVIKSTQDRVDRLEASLGLMSEQLNDAMEALARVEKLNPKTWQESKGGSRLQDSVARSAATCRTIAKGLDRIRRETEAAAGGAQAELDLY